jgi:uroporphyrinogen decarboxylase
VRTRADVDALAPRPVDEVVPFVGEAIRLLRRELDGRTPVLGFCGAPFTLAAYLAEGHGRDGFGAVQTMRHREPATLVRLLEKLAAMSADYLALQIRAGAQAVQIFDSWVGLLSAEDYRTLVLPSLRELVSRTRAHGVPVIYFAQGASHLLEDAARTGADVLGVCWRTSLAEVRSRIGERITLQGNLDPHALLSSPEHVGERARAVLESAGHGGAHVFNLGHGILPETPLAAVETLVETVHTHARSLT